MELQLDGTLFMIFISIGEFVLKMQPYIMILTDQRTIPA